MTQYLRRLGLALLAPLTVTTIMVYRATAAERSGAVVPDEALTEIIKGAVTKVHKAVDDKPTDRATPALVRIQAALIALCAQQQLSGPHAPEMAAVQEAALKLAASVQRRRLNVEQAKKQTETLAGFPGIKAEAASTEPADLTKKFSLETVMKVFDKTSKGGDGIEQLLLTLDQQRRPYSPAQMSDQLVADAYKAVLVAEVARRYQPEKNRTDREGWEQLCNDMKTNAGQLAQVVKQRDPKEVKAAIRKLNASCNQCHEKFR